MNSLGQSRWNRSIGYIEHAAQCMNRWSVGAYLSEVETLGELSCETEVRKRDSDGMVQNTNYTTAFSSVLAAFVWKNEIHLRVKSKVT